MHRSGALTLAASLCSIDGVGNTKTALAPKCVIAMGGTFWRRSPGEDAQATFWQAESNGSDAWRLACIGLPFAFCRAPSLTPSIHRKGKTGAMLSTCSAALKKRPRRHRRSRLSGHWHNQRGHRSLDDHMKHRQTAKTRGRGRLLKAPTHGRLLKAPQPANTHGRLLHPA